MKRLVSAGLLLAGWLALNPPFVFGEESGSWAEGQDPALQGEEVLDVLRDVGVLDAQAHAKARERLKPGLATALRPYVEVVGTFTALNDMPADEVIVYPGGPDKERGFALRKTAFGFHGRAFYEWLSVKLTASAEQQQDGTMAFDLENAYVQAHFAPEEIAAQGVAPEFGVHLGAMKVPFSRQSLSSEAQLQFVNRAVVVEEIDIRRDVGATLDAGVTLGDEVAAIRLRGGAFNGQGYKVYSADNNEKLMYVVRGVADLLGAIGPGEGDPSRETLVGGLFSGDLELVKPRVSLGGSFLQNNDIDRKVKSWGIDAELRWMGLSLLGEYIATEYDYDLAVNVVGDVKAGRWERDGWYVQGGLFVWPRLVELVFRYEEYRVDLLNQLNDEARIALTSGGANLYLTRRNNLKLMADYTHRQEKKGFPELDNDSFTLGLSLIF